MKNKTKLTSQQIDAIIEGLAMVRMNLENFFKTRQPLYYELTKMQIDAVNGLLIDDDEEGEE